MKINISTNPIQKKARIQPAARVNSDTKWKPTINDKFVKGQFFKLKKNNDISIVNTEGQDKINTIVSGVESGIDFKKNYFNLNEKRHQLGNSNQG